MDKKNEAEGYIYSVEKSLNDEQMKEKFTDDERKQLEDLVKEAKEAIDSKNDEKMFAKKEELEKVYAPIITRIYQESMPKDENGNVKVDPNMFKDMFGSANGFAQGQKFDPSQFAQATPKE